MGAEGMTAPFQIGQTVFVPLAGIGEGQWVTCPMCAGSCRVTVVTADGAHHPAPCGDCSLGQAAGRVIEYHVTSRVAEATVTGISLRSGQWEIDTTASSGLDPSSVFADRDAAEARRVEMHAEQEASRQRQREASFCSGRERAAWSLSYHRRAAKDAREKLEYHESKIRELNAAKKGAA